MFRPLKCNTPSMLVLKSLFLWGLADSADEMRLIEWRNAMRKLLPVLIAAIVTWPTFGVASPQKDAVLRFYELREKTLDQRGTTQDVDKLLSLLTDEARYEHPVASVVMTKAQARSGMLAHLREGRDARYMLRRAHFMNDFAVVEFLLEYTLEDKRISRAGVALFEFSGDKISRVAEY